MQLQEIAVVMIDTPATQQLRVTLADALERRIDELVDAVCSAVFAEVNPYTQLGRPATAKSFRADVRGSLDTYIRTIADGSGLTEDDLERFRELGAERARQGLAAEDVTDAFEAGMTACWHYVRAAALEVHDQRLATEVVADLAVEAFAALNDVAAALAEGHAAERGRGTYNQARAGGEFVARLIDGTWSDERDLHRAARSLGADIDRQWTLLVLTRLDARDGSDLDRQAAELGQVLPQVFVGSTRAVPTPHVAVLVPGEDEQPAPEVLEAAAAVAAEHDLLIVVPEATWAWTALPHVYRRQSDSVVCARAVARGPGVVRDGDCGLYRLLRELPMSSRVDFVRSVLGPVLDLPAGKSTEALATLDAYFRGRGRLDETAADLQLHRNSFRYRLERAQTILGVNFRSGLDRLRVELALALRRLDREEAVLLERGNGAGDAAARLG